MLVQIEAIDLVGFGLGEMIFLQEVFFHFYWYFSGESFVPHIKGRQGDKEKWNVEQRGLGMWSQETSQRVMYLVSIENVATHNRHHFDLSIT